jgi:mannitol-1-phosphate 5-dehydrogenase
MTRAKTFVGFGFGPIQSALFLYEAFRSGRFSRFVIAEVDAGIVQAVRSAGGRYTLNLACPDRIEQDTVAGVELYHPGVAEDRQRILAAIAESDELATSLPSVSYFDDGGPASVARLLAEGLSRRTRSHPTIVYTAENHNHAAELLQEAVRRCCVPGALQNVQFLNTVIGKMSGVISDPATCARLNLAPMTPGWPKAVLVEEFNRILITQIALPGFVRGIDVFVEKPELLPFEEAKLYGHNAIHALIGYLAARRGLTAMSDAAAHPDIMAVARAAFLEESGAALIRRHGSLGDPLFTPAGYAAYADDLLSRMVRPTLNDLIVRVTRDPVRKLGYDDRLFGTMRLALAGGLRPVNLARGAAAAVLALLGQWDSLGPAFAGRTRPALPLSRSSLDQLLRSVWSAEPGPDAPTLVDLTCEGLGSVPHGPSNSHFDFGGS